MRDDETFGELPPGPASRFTVTAFDDYLTDATATAFAFSNPLLDELLGLFDQLAIEVVVDEWTGVGPVNFKARIQHSSNGRGWMSKGATNEIPLTALVPGKNILPIGYDNGEIPSLGLVRVRFEVQANSGAVEARVKAKITGNDFDQIDFSRWIQRFRERNKNYYEALDANTQVQRVLAGKRPEQGQK